MTPGAVALSSPLAHARSPPDKLGIPMPTGAPTAQNPAVPLRYRLSISDLTDAQVAELRAAFDDMQKISDERGYQYWSGIHGLPLPAWCDKYGHGKPTFLHWHRAYLAQFEKCLRDAGTGHDVMIPWWDWLNEPRVPVVYGAAKTPDGQSNPLHSVKINDEALQQGKRGAIPGDQEELELARQPQTARNPGLPGTQLPTKADIDEVLAYRDFQSFSSNLEDWHGQVHVWVGGHMSDIPYAAYDPIFWSHHAMIDRIWRIWQLQNPTTASLPPALANQVMQPFGVTAAHTLDVTTFGYDYATAATIVSVTA
jgi:tyrosinase